MLKKAKKLAKYLLAITWVRKTHEGVARGILEVFAANRLLTALYSIPGFVTFNREQYAVLRGRRNYYRNLKKKRTSHVELRRNTHMLEKGITMRPRRPVFAKEYIVETVEFYEHAVHQYCQKKDSLDESELAWSHSVLSEYFYIVPQGNDEAVDTARKRFAATEKDYNPEVVEMVPFERAVGEKSDVGYEELLALANNAVLCGGTKTKKFLVTLSTKHSW